VFSQHVQNKIVHMDKLVFLAIHKRLHNTAAVNFND